jgi:hypothetical protein
MYNIRPPISSNCGVPEAQAVQHAVRDLPSVPQMCSYCGTSPKRSFMPLTLCRLPHLEAQYRTHPETQMFKTWYIVRPRL